MPNKADLSNDPQMRIGLEIAESVIRGDRPATKAVKDRNVLARCLEKLADEITAPVLTDYPVKVYTDAAVYIEIIQGAYDFTSACRNIMTSGLYTSDENGPLYFPPHQIRAIRFEDAKETDEF